MTIVEYENKYDKYIQTFDDGSMYGYAVIQVSEEDFEQVLCWNIGSDRILSADPALDAEEILDIKSVLEEYNEVRSNN